MRQVLFFLIVFANCFDALSFHLYVYMHYSDVLLLKLPLSLYFERAKTFPNHSNQVGHIRSIVYTLYFFVSSLTALYLSHSSHRMRLFAIRLPCLEYAYSYKY